MGTIAIVILILVVIIYIVSVSKKNKTPKVRRKILPEKKIKTVVNNSVQKIDDKLLYKNNGIKTFDMKGMFFQALDPKINIGEFFGTAICEDNYHDMYAVVIFNQQNEILGYVPKGNKRLHNSIIEWNNGKVPAWGKLEFNEYNDSWFGTVNIPVGFTEEDILSINLILKLKSENQAQIKKNEKSIEKYFDILNKHKEILNLISSLKIKTNLDYSFPRNLIPIISKYLENEKKWNELLELEKFQDLISELSPKYKETTLKRIEKAKNNHI